MSNYNNYNDYNLKFQQLRSKLNQLNKDKMIINNYTN